MQASLNEEIFGLAAREDRVKVPADTDFATLLALRKTAKPSGVIFCRSSGRRPELQAKLLLEYLPRVEEPLNQRSVVVIEEARIRIRTLPIDEGYGR